MLNGLIKFLLLLKFKTEKEKTIAWTIPIDEYTDINILLETNGKIGTQIVNSDLDRYYK